MLSYFKKLLFGEEGINEKLVNKVLTNLNKDVARQILMELDDEDILKICEFQNSVSRDICDNAFFYNLLNKKYSNVVKYKPEELSWKKYYLRVIYYLAKLEEEYDFKFTKKSKLEPKIYYNILSMKNLEASLENAALLGLKDLVEFFINSEELEDIDTSNIFLQAVQGNDKATIYYLLNLENIEKDWNIALYKAASNKNKELINLFLEKGANVNEGLQGAALSGDMSLINFFLKKGANDWNNAIYAAAMSKEENKKIIAFFIDKAEKDGVSIDWKLALSGAAHSGNLSLFKFFYKHTDIDQGDLNNLIQASIRSNSKEIVKYLISLGFKNWDLGEKYAQIYNNKEMVEFFLKKKNE